MWEQQVLCFVLVMRDNNNIDSFRFHLLQERWMWSGGANPLDGPLICYAMHKAFQVVNRFHCPTHTRSEKWGSGIVSCPSERLSNQLMIISLWSRKNSFQLNVLVWTWIFLPVQSFVQSIPGSPVFRFTVPWLWIRLDHTCTERSEIIFFTLPAWQSNKSENHSKHKTYCF